MPFITSLAFLLSVLLITLVSAIPAAAPDKYIHFNAPPGCPNTRAISCLRLRYCKEHRDRGDLFTTKYLSRRDDVPELENLDFSLTDGASSSSSTTTTTTRGYNLFSKRWVLYHCGILSTPSSRDASIPINDLVAGALYDFIVDYPYDGATGGMVGLFSLVLINSVLHVICIAYAPTGTGGTRFSFHAPQNAVWYQVILLGDNPATAAIQYFIGRHD